MWPENPEEEETGGDILRRDNKANNYSDVFPEEGVHFISMVEQCPIIRIGAMSPGQPVLRSFLGGGNQFSSVAQSCLTLCDPMNHSTPGLPVHHPLREFTQTHVHWVSDAIQPSHSLLSPSPLAFNLSQHQGLFQWVSSLHPVAKVLEFQLQHQSFQWIFRTDLL